MAELPPEMRRQIDAAVAAGAVQVIPPGVSGYPTLVWCKRRKQLMYPEGQAPSAAWRVHAGTRSAAAAAGAARAGRACAARHAAAREVRHARLKEVFTPEKSTTELAAEVGCSVATISADLKILGLRLGRVPSIHPKVLARRAALAKLAQGGQVTDAILRRFCAVHGISRDAARMDARRLGLAWAVTSRRPGRPAGAARPAVDRAVLAPLYADPELSWADIAARLRLTVSATRAAAEQHGLIGPGGRANRRKWAIDEAAFRAAWADPALSAADLAQKFGRHRETLRRHAVALGLPKRPPVRPGPKTGGTA